MFNRMNPIPALGYIPLQTTSKKPNRSISFISEVFINDNYSSYQLVQTLPKAVVTISTSPTPPTSVRTKSAAVHLAVPPGGDRMANLEKQMGVVIQTLSTMSSEMSSFQKAVSNMDVLVRSVQEMQESESWRSGHSAALTSPSPSSTPPVLPSGNARPKRNSGSDFVSPHGSQGSRVNSSMNDTDLRIERLVKAAVDLHTPFRVSVCKVMMSPLQLILCDMSTGQARRHGQPVVSILFRPFRGGPIRTNPRCHH